MKMSTRPPTLSLDKVPLSAPLEEESVARRLAEHAAAAAEAEKTTGMEHMPWGAKEAELEGRGSCFGLL